MAGKKSLHVLVVFCFCFWLLPLGRFIDKAHEATACGGARAVCLCCMHWQVPKPIAGKMITANTGHHEQRAPGGGAGYEFERLASRILEAPDFSKIFLQNQETYGLLTEGPQDPIPKA